MIRTLFQSGKAQILGIIFLVVGGVLAMRGWSYSDATKREASVAGTITQASCGRSCTYDYVFKIKGVSMSDRTSTCRTALTPRGCKTGAPVLVYYDPEDVAETALEEFGAAARARIFMGVWMLSCGLILIGINAFLNRKNGNQEVQEDTSASEGGDQSDAIHVVPDE